MRDVAKFGWTVLPYPPYSLDLASSDCHLFGPVKDGLCKHFPDNDAIIALDADFYECSMQAFVHRW
jgi:hypothetical protein